MSFSNISEKKEQNKIKKPFRGKLHEATLAQQNKENETETFSGNNFDIFSETFQ